MELDPGLLPWFFWPLLAVVLAGGIYEALIRCAAERPTLPWWAHVLLFGGLWLLVYAAVLMILERLTR